MKKFIVSLLCSIALLTLASTTEVKAQESKGAYFNTVRDTTSGADTLEYEIAIPGKKDVVTFQIDAFKISGTPAGSINVYGSANGSTYIDTALASSITIQNATRNYGFSFSNNAYKKYKIVIITSGTQSSSYRPYYLYR